MQKIRPCSLDSGTMDDTIHLSELGHFDRFGKMGYGPVAVVAGSRDGRFSLFERGVSPRTFRIITSVAVAGVAFQVAHFVEHIAQLGYWFMHPLEAPWLTPWAAVGRDALAAGGNAATGTELLHLIGNVVFFVGLIGLCVTLACKRRALGDHPPLRKAVSWQGFHVVEHIALTTTWLLFGKAIGVSTLFGLVAAGPFLSSYRVWWHFMINLIATVYAVRAIREFADERLLYPDLSPAPA